MPRRAPSLVSAAVALALLLAFPSARADGAALTGGASADAAGGGMLDPGRSGALAYGVPTRQRPVARVFSVSPRSVREGVRPLVRVRVDERGVDHVAARVVVLDVRTHRTAARFGLGRVVTGRVVRVRWPKGAILKAGSYLVRLHVKDPQGATLARASRLTGKARLVVRPRPRPESPQPEPQRQTSEPARPNAPAAVRNGGVFPVQGPYTWGGKDASFGASRPGHVHEGQDLMAAEGTPVVSPLPGVVRFADHQARGAGWYVVVDADDGRTFFFAHCQAGSTSVVVGQRVAAGQGVCRVGSTGSATGPHLHFEIWVGGWRDRGGRAIDPVEQLRAWAG